MKRLHDMGALQLVSRHMPSTDAGVADAVSSLATLYMRCRIEILSLALSASLSTIPVPHIVRTIQTTTRRVKGPYRSRV